MTPLDLRSLRPLQIAVDLATARADVRARYFASADRRCGATGDPWTGDRVLMNQKPVGTFSQRR